MKVMVLQLRKISEEFEVPSEIFESEMKSFVKQLDHTDDISLLNYSNQIRLLHR